MVVYCKIGSCGYDLSSESWSFVMMISRSRHHRCSSLSFVAGIEWRAKAGQEQGHVQGLAGRQGQWGRQRLRQEQSRSSVANKRVRVSSISQEDK
jgi:hypothetical protein